MLLRPRQKEFVIRSLDALNAYGNALGVAPTGAGKTILFSEVIGRYIAVTSAKSFVIRVPCATKFQLRDFWCYSNPK